MSDIEVQGGVQVTGPKSPPGQLDISGEKERTSRIDSLHKTGERETDEPLSLLVDVALATPCGDHATCSCDCEVCRCLQVRRMEGSLQSMQLQLQFLMSKADDLQECLVEGQGPLANEALAAAVPSFLYTCQPYFNHLESTTRSTASQHTLLPFDIYTRRVQLLDFSQQLCDRLEQLVLTYASHNVLCLDETEPNSVSHFCIGQSQLGGLRLTAFLYCKPTPFLARLPTGLHKRMRWNVERLGGDDEQQQQEQRADEEEREADTEYYFLCCEDIPNTHAEPDGENKGGVSHSDVVRMWSIGQWVQVSPDTDDISDWILCEVPEASYHRLLFLGSEEPSSCSATDYLQQLLLSRQTTDGYHTPQDAHVSAAAK